MSYKRGLKMTFNKIEKKWIYLCIALVGGAFFWLLGENGYVMGGDSELYINFGHYSGVQPLYPLFIQICRKCFGNGIYLDAVSFIQGGLALAGCICLVRFLDKSFRLENGSVVVLFLFSLMPYAIEIPGHVISHEIMTEGLSYPLFYFFVLLVLKALFEKKFLPLVGAHIMSLVLSLIRPQMQFLFAVVLIIGVYMIMKKNWKRKIVVFFVSLFMLLGVCGLELKSVLWIDGVYESVFFEGHSQNSANYTVQARVLYASNAEDIELFSDPVMKALYQKTYDKMEEMETTWRYTPNNLWRWKHIVGGTGMNSRIVQGYVEEYLRNDVGLTKDIEVEQTKNKICGEMMNVLLKKNWGRYLINSFQLMPSGFVASVLFQKEGFYVLCHIGTLLLYLAAIGIVVLFYIRRDLDNRIAETVLLISGTAIMNVVSTNLILFGLQRYMVYTYGMFYMAMFLAMRALWRKYGWNFRKK